MTSRLPSLLLALIGTAFAELSPDLPAVTLSRSPAGQVTLDWPTVPGQTYRLERSASMAAAEWQTVRPTEEATGLPMTFTETPEATTLFYRLAVDPAKPLVSKIAVMGDSITAQTSRNLYHISAMGYSGWARFFGGARWDLVANPADNTRRFATSGKRAFEVSALHLSQVIAAAPDACIIVYGTNDAAQLSPSVASFRTQILSDWSALRDAGIQPVAVTVLPIGSATMDNSARQARVVELNTVLREETAAQQIPLCDWTGLLEAVPGSNTGVGLNAHYQNNDDYHPLQFPASLIGRALNATLQQHFRFGIDPWQNTGWITPNVALDGSNGQPTGNWQIFPPSGSTIDSKTLIPSPEGNWWEIAFTKGSSTGNFYVNAFGTNLGGSPAGHTVEAVTELQVMSGSIAGAFLQTGSGLATDMNEAGGTGAQILPSDGIVVLRTPPVLVPAGTTNVIPTLGFRSNDPTATVRIRRCGIRKLD